MSEILSAEEKERIRKEQLRRAAELQKRKSAADSPGVVVDADPAEAERRRQRAVEDYKARVLDEEMTRRGFVKHAGTWVSREEFERLKAAEEEERQRLVGKVERAKERAIDRDEEHYRELKESSATQQRAFLQVFYAGTAAFAAGLALLWLFGVKMVGLAAFLNVVGGSAAVFALIFLFEIEKGLMRAQRVVHDGEVQDFEYDDIPNPIRRMLRRLARQYDPDIAKFF